MDVLKISLEALLQRATNPQNQNIDTAAVEAICALINKEKEGPLLGVKLLAVRIHSKHEQEVLQALHILDVSMQKCGSAFQSEVGKFRFLNEMIKLVSPKYLGCYTAPSVKQKVLQLMYLWTLDYPKETKIKEAYDMLKKQGVIKDVPLSVSADKNGAQENRVNTLFQDEEKSKLLKKLLQSKNPEDLQAANRLIKTMVKEDERKAEMKSKKISELESIQNNVRLLNEMLESYKPGISSQDELELIKELHESCERLRPNIVKLASETQQNEDILGEILRVNDELGQVFDKFKAIILKEGIAVAGGGGDSLLDLSGNLLGAVNMKEAPGKASNSPPNNIDILCDILTSPIVAPVAIETNTGDILKPVAVNQVDLLTDNSIDNDKASKLKALDDLDALGEHLLRQNLSPSQRLGPQFNKIPEKVPMNLLAKQTPISESESNENSLWSSSADPLNFDLTSLIETPKHLDLSECKSDNSGDDLLVDISEGVLEEKKSVAEEICEEAKPKPELKMADLFVDLKSIKPSSIKPVSILDERNEVSVTLHFARDKPHEDVTVIVVTIVSKNELAVKNILFRAIVPKECKVKLQPASGTELPPYNPFIPPAAITQIMLIANPVKIKASVKFIVSYTIDDETMTEMGEIESLPALL